MKFGKLSNVDEVDFSLPDFEFLGEPKSPEAKIELYLGTTGWSNKEWKGSYYPKTTKAAYFLNEYANLFNTIELNSTHYHIPSVECVRTWKEKVKDGFLFCPKVPQEISHRYNLASETSQTNSFYKSIGEFGDSLGHCFMQLPDHFSPKRADELLHFLGRKPQGLKLAIELRNKEWFADDQRQLRMLARELAKSKIDLLVTDVAGRRDVCHGIFTGDTLMLRLVGNSQHPSDDKRMDAWVAKIIDNQYKINKIYLFFHQPSMEDIPQMVNYFIQKLEKKGLKSPISMLKPKYQSDIQLSLF